MNIFKKIKLANKLIKAYTDIQFYLDTHHLTEDTKDDIKIIKERLERLSNRIPEYKEAFDIIKGLLKK